MKNYISKFIVLVAISLSLSAGTDAQITVRIRPHAPVLPPRPPRPSPAHIWISGEWTWGNGNYQYKDGYWDRPRDRRHRGWAEGHWKHTRRGWVWVPGRWR